MEQSVKSKVDDLSKEEVRVLTHQSLEEILGTGRIRWVLAESLLAPPLCA